MNQWPRIAFRNTTRQKKRSLLLAGAIAFGFLVITLLNGFTDGLLVSVKDNFTNIFGGHIYISGSIVNDRNAEISVIDDPSAVYEALEETHADILSISKRSRASGDVYFGTRSRIQTIEGVDFEQESGFLEGLKIVQGSIEDLDQPNAVLLPEDTAERLKVEIGEPIIFKTSTLTGQQNVVELLVVGTFAGQSAMGITSSYANLADINNMIGLEADRFQSLNLYLTDVEDMDAVAESMYQTIKLHGDIIPRGDEATEEDEDSARSSMFAAFGGGNITRVDEADSWEGTRFALTTLNDFTDQLDVLVGILNGASLGIFIVLLVITMVGIMNSYRMVMIERTKEIGSMRAMGVQRTGIRRIFLWEAFIIAFIGALGGFIIALIIMKVFSLFTFDSIGFAFFTQHGHFYFLTNMAISLRNFVIVCLMSLFAVSIPARAASKLSPAAALSARN